MAHVPKIGLPATTAIIFFLCGIFGYPLSDSDYFWHLKTGQLILETGSIPTSEPFSFSAAGRPWLVQGGIFDAAMAAVHDAFGESGVRFFFSAWVLATWMVVYRSIRLFLDREAPALALVLFFSLGGMLYVTARPLVVTLLGFALTHHFLLRHRITGRAAWLFPIPLVMCVWINAHFGYVLGLGLIGMFFLADLLSRWMPLTEAPPVKGRLTFVRFAALFAASLVFLGINPAGYEVLVATVQKTMVDSASPILEWQSPDFHQRAGQMFLAAVGVTVFSLVFGKRRTDWLEIVVLTAMAGAAFYSMRHMPVAAIALAPIAASGFSGFRPQPWRNEWLSLLPRSVLAKGTRELGPATHVLNLLLIGFVTIALLALRPSIAAWHDNRLRALLPVDAAAFVESNGLHGRIFNDYVVGGYLLWRLYPESRVFVDGRFNPYMPDVFDAFMRIHRQRKGWLETLAAQSPDLVLLASPGTGLAQALSASGQYRFVYADQFFGVLIRNDGRRPDLGTVEAGDSIERPR